MGVERHDGRGGRLGGAGVGGRRWRDHDHRHGGTPPAGTAEITVENPDRAALVALYHATDGPNWTRNENWLTEARWANGTA